MILRIFPILVFLVSCSPLGNSASEAQSEAPLSLPLIGQPSDDYFSGEQGDVGLSSPSSTSEGQVSDRSLHPRLSYVQIQADQNFLTMTSRDFSICRISAYRRPSRITDLHVQLYNEDLRKGFELTLYGFDPSKRGMKFINDFQSRAGGLVSISLGRDIQYISRNAIESDRSETSCEMNYRVNQQNFLIASLLCYKLYKKRIFDGPYSPEGFALNSAKISFGGQMQIQAYFQRPLRTFSKSLP